MKAPQSELGKPQKKFSETFSAMSLLRERFFPTEEEKENVNEKNLVYRELNKHED